MKKNIYLLIAVLILGLIAFFTYSKKQKTKKNNGIKKIISFNEKDAYKWEINYNNIKIVCEKISNKWYIVYPKKYEASQNEVLANVKNFNTLEYKKIIEYTTNNKTKWGITQNYYKIFLKDEDNKLSSYTFMSGNRSFDEKGYYVSIDSSTNIYLVESWVVLALQKKLNDLRDKDFLKVEPEDIVKIRFKDNVFTKIGLNWRYNKLDDDKLDLKKVDKIAQDIGFMVAKDIMPDDYVFDKSKTELKIYIDVAEKKKLKLSSTNISKKIIKEKMKNNTVINKFKRTLYLYHENNKLLGKSDNNKYTYIILSSFYNDFTNSAEYYVKTNIFGSTNK